MFFVASDSRDVMDGHVQRVFSVQFHPAENHLLASGGWDDTVQFWDDRAPHAVRYVGRHSSILRNIHSTLKTSTCMFSAFINCRHGVRPVALAAHLKCFSSRDRKLYGPHICGDALDIDAAHHHILTGSWRKDNVLQVADVIHDHHQKDM